MLTSVQSPKERKSMQPRCRNHAGLLEYTSVFVTLNTTSIVLRKYLREILPIFKAPLILIHINTYIILHKPKIVNLFEWKCWGEGGGSQCIILKTLCRLDGHIRDSVPP